MKYPASKRWLGLTHGGRPPTTAPGGLYAPDCPNRTAKQAPREACTTKGAAGRAAAKVGSFQSYVAQDTPDAIAQGAGTAMTDDELRGEINKRLTLNWLIQGAAQHAGMTFHHLVRDELDALDPRLLLLYDQYALINLLQYWQVEGVLLLGWPPWFWRRAGSNPRHPFFEHPLLSRFGGILAAAAKRRALDRCKEKRVTRIPVLFAFQTLNLVAHLKAIEAPHRPKLVELAKKSASTIWGIPTERLDADLGKPTPFGTPIRIRNFQGAIFHASLVGLGGVVQRDDSLVVVARGTNWQLLTKELVKGTAELICLHGLNDLSEDTYRQVMDATDRIDYEPWMLQTGGELWRRLLEVVPDGRPMANVMMCMARLPPKSFESLMLAVIEQPEWARELLAKLTDEIEPALSD